MARLIKKLRNNRAVIFDTGNFDDWCVYVVEANGYKMAPFDETYFGELYVMSNKYPQNKVYNDFVLIYDRTTKLIDTSVLKLIDDLVNTYAQEDRVIIEQWFSVIYAGMMAEENKEFAILKKRVKRLGMHQVLMLHKSAKVAAEFSKGKKWRELDDIMKPLGF